MPKVIFHGYHIISLHKSVMPHKSVIPTNMIEDLALYEILADASYPCVVLFSDMYHIFPYHQVFKLGNFIAILLMKHAHVFHFLPPSSDVHFTESCTGFLWAEL